MQTVPGSHGLAHHSPPGDIDIERTPLALGGDSAMCGGEVRTTFRTIPAFVAQWIEQRFPKPQVACSIHAEGAK